MKTSPNKNKLLSIVDDLIDKGEIEIIVDNNGIYFINIPNGEFTDIVELDSKSGKKYIYRYLLHRFEYPVSNATLSCIIQHLEYTIDINKCNTTIHNRIAYFNSTYIFKIGRNIDSFISVRKTKIRILKKVDCHFKLSPNALALPPVKKATLNKLNSSKKLKESVNLLFKYINVRKKDRVLVLAWLLESFRPETTYPLLFLKGRQGSAKTTTQDILCQFIDPHSCNITTNPRSIDDLFTKASNNYLLSFDNMPKLSSNFQDAFCCIATGGKYVKRKIFSDSEESIQHIKKPTIISAIKNVITHSDLLDRTITLNIPRLEKTQRTAKIMADFDKDKAIIFTGLIKLFRKVLEKCNSIEIDETIRLVDYQITGETICQVLKLKQSFTKSILASRKEQITNNFEDDPMFQTIMSYFIKKKKGHSGSIGTLLEKLQRNKPSYLNKKTTPKQLSNFLKEHEVPLSILGINRREIGRKSDGYHIEIETS